MRLPYRMPFAAMLMAMSIAGCSNADNPEPTAALPSATVQNLCGAAENIKQHLASADVQTIDIVGQCTSLTIRTTLNDDASEAATKLCEKAAEIAYTGDVNAVTVLGATGRELAIGISGMKCLASQ
jgi:hypothetical protein